MIQKVPPLLDEVHWLIENRGLHFGLCGSRARRTEDGIDILPAAEFVRRIAKGTVAQ